jgi:NAD+ diphosphatase
MTIEPAPRRLLREIVAPQPFTGASLDRAEEVRKDSDAVRRLLGSPGARSVLAGRDGVLVSRGALVRASVVSDPGSEPILLGLDGEGRPLFAADLDGLTPGERERCVDGGAAVMPLREAGSTLPHAEGGLAAYASALLNWHRRHGFCANCGAATDITEAGYSRRCPRCGLSHFPRTDPVVIMTVSDGDRLLLGRRSGGPPGRMSVLAGFVSPGESAEEAVVREVREESGVEAADPVYVASQPWPFPASLMLGFDARSAGGEPRARDGELAEVRWVGLDEIRAAVREEHPSLRLPAPVSIARFLIERWVAQRDGGA